ncbi:GNAT family N-acetyltransferase [Mesorhizobium sp. NPDC059025]|uniref:GNAT family N-acetyltransferase n=1 Tax=unclassified Mesorhizobium TaxID=325217 RepID=UPI0036964B56
MSKLIFEQMNLNSDFDKYHRLARVEMSDNDLVDGRELRQLIAEQAVRAWWVCKPEQIEPVGWCAVMDPPPFGWESKTAHILGVMVLGPEKGKGVGREIIRWLVNQLSGRSLTAAISPANFASERAFQSMGFVLVAAGEDELCHTWRRLPTDPLPS